ncbi:MAG: hypothetical protein ACR2PT_10700 [Endozoicomonas sp.]
MPFTDMLSEESSELRTRHKVMGQDGAIHVSHQSNTMLALNQKFIYFFQHLTECFELCRSLTVILIPVLFIGWIIPLPCSDESSG